MARRTNSSRVIFMLPLLLLPPLLLLSMDACVCP
jgi:hypothetical protein